MTGRGQEGRFIACLMISRGVAVNSRHFLGKGESGSPLPSPLSFVAFPLAASPSSFPRKRESSVYLPARSAAFLEFDFAAYHKQYLPMTMRGAASETADSRRACRRH
jgi:hypothetical protein